jgi:hypothetical protein
MTTREVRAALAARSPAAAMPGKDHRARHAGIIALAVAGLAAMTSAAFNRTRFASSGQNGDSMAMALTWAVALLCYLSFLFVAGRNRSPHR